MTLLDYWSSLVANKGPLERSRPVREAGAATAAQVFYAHAPLVYKLACRMLGNETDAEDVTQEVLLRVLRKFNSFRGEGRLTTWLHRVTVNASLEHRRKALRRRERETDIPFAEQIHASAEAQAYPDQRLLADERRELIDQAIARLPAIYREVYVLADLEELSNAEISATLQLSVAAVKSRLRRARLMMREALAGHV